MYGKLIGEWGPTKAECLDWNTKQVFCPKNRVLFMACLVSKAPDQGQTSDNNCVICDTTDYSHIMT